LKDKVSVYFHKTNVQYYIPITLFPFTELSHTDNPDILHEMDF